MLERQAAEERTQTWGASSKCGTDLEAQLADAKLPPCPMASQQSVCRYGDYGSPLFQPYPSSPCIRHPAPPSTPVRPQPQAVQETEGTPYLQVSAKGRHRHRCGWRTLHTTHGLLLTCSFLPYPPPHTHPSGPSPKPSKKRKAPSKPAAEAGADTDAAGAAATDADSSKRIAKKAKMAAKGAKRSAAAESDGGDRGEGGVRQGTGEKEQQEQGQGQEGQEQQQRAKGKVIVVALKGEEQRKVRGFWGACKMATAPS